MGRLWTLRERWAMAEECRWGCCGHCVSYGIDVLEGWSLWCAAVSLCRSVGCSSVGRLIAAV